MKLHHVAVLFLLAAGGAASGQDGPQEPDRQQQPATAAVPPALLDEQAVEPLDDEEGNEVVCRTERLTGSLTRRRRTCMTRNEWAELERDTTHGMNEFNRTASGGRQCTTGPMGGC